MRISLFHGLCVIPLNAWKQGSFVCTWLDFPLELIRKSSRVRLTSEQAKSQGGLTVMWSERTQEVKPEETKLGSRVVKPGWPIKRGMKRNLEKIKPGVQQWGKKLKCSRWCLQGQIMTAGTNISRGIIPFISLCFYGPYTGQVLHLD